MLLNYLGFKVDLRHGKLSTSVCVCLSVCVFVSRPFRVATCYCQTLNLRGRINMTGKTRLFSEFFYYKLSIKIIKTILKTKTSLEIDVQQI
jgi:hypothetical protein